MCGFGKNFAPLGVCVLTNMNVATRTRFPSWPHERSVDGKQRATFTWCRTVTPLLSPRMSGPACPRLSCVSFSVGFCWWPPCPSCANWRWRVSSLLHPIPGIQGAFSLSVQTSVTICPGAVTLMSSHLSKQTPSSVMTTTILKAQQTGMGHKQRGRPSLAVSKCWMRMFC